MLVVIVTIAHWTFRCLSFSVILLAFQTEPFIQPIEINCFYFVVHHKGFLIYDDSYVYSSKVEMVINFPI